jgi:chaperonin cofactor prefoldin
LIVKTPKSDQNQQTMRQQFQERISGLEQEMKKIEISLNEFLNTVTQDFRSLIGKIVLMKENMAARSGRCSMRFSSSTA